MTTITPDSLLTLEAYAKIQLPTDSRDAVRAGAAVKLGCDHTNYPAHVAISPETLTSLAGDLS